MTENKEHFRHIMLFYFRKGKNASHIFFSASAKHCLFGNKKAQYVENAPYFLPFLMFNKI